MSIAHGTWCCTVPLARCCWQRNRRRRTIITVWAVVLVRWVALRTALCVIPIRLQRSLWWARRWAASRKMNEAVCSHALALTYVGVCVLRWANYYHSNECAEYDYLKKCTYRRADADWACVWWIWERNWCCDARAGARATRAFVTHNIINHIKMSWCLPRRLCYYCFLVNEEIGRNARIERVVGIGWS